MMCKRHLALARQAVDLVGQQVIVTSRDPHDPGPMTTKGMLHSIYALGLHLYTQDGRWPSERSLEWGSVQSIEPAMGARRSEAEVMKREMRGPR